MPIDDQISKIRIQIGREAFTIGELLGVNQDSMSDEFARQAARLAWAGLRLADAEALYETAKHNKDVSYAEADDEARRALSESDEKATEQRIRMLIMTDDLYLKAAESERDALYNYRIMRAVVDAMRQRGDMLVSLGATLRQEWDSLGMSVAEHVKSKLRDK